MWLGRVYCSTAKSAPVVPFEVSKFVQLYSTIQCRRVLGKSILCQRLGLNFGALQGLSQQRLDKLLQQVIHELSPTELAVCCGSIKPLHLRRDTGYKPLKVRRLTVFIYNGVDLGSLANLLDLVSDTVENLALLLRDSRELDNASAADLIPDTPAPETGFLMPKVPHLKTLCMWRDWHQDCFEAGEMISFQNLMEAIPKQCVVKGGSHPGDWDFALSKPPWHDRVEQSKQIDLE